MRTSQSIKDYPFEVRIMHKETGDSKIVAIFTNKKHAEDKLSTCNLYGHCPPDHYYYIVTAIL